MLEGVFVGFPQMGRVPSRNGRKEKTSLPRGRWTQSHLAGKNIGHALHAWACIAPRCNDDLIRRLKVVYPSRPPIDAPHENILNGGGREGNVLFFKKPKKEFRGLSFYKTIGPALDVCFVPLFTDVLER